MFKRGSGAEDVIIAARFNGAPFRRAMPSRKMRSRFPMRDGKKFSPSDAATDAGQDVGKLGAVLRWRQWRLILVILPTARWCS